ncbi:hypothetical protein ABW19_dt0205719 [Dactylella cylindrospora]|nr:hypothetical protein ABW19_dt0205719 [Dactylella cylindrospora]
MSLPDFRIPISSLPDRLYRIHCPPDSHTYYSQANGFTSKSSIPISLTDRSAFLPALTCHLNWYSTESSPFISTFSRMTHVRGWIKRWFQNHPSSKKVQIMEINPRLMLDERMVQIPVISVLEVVESLGKGVALPSVRTVEQIEDEYLCVGKVPAKAIVSVEDVWRDGEQQWSLKEEDQTKEQKFTGYGRGLDVNVNVNFNVTSVDADMMDLDLPVGAGMEPPSVGVRTGGVLNVFQMGYRIDYQGGGWGGQWGQGQNGGYTGSSGGYAWGSTVFFPNGY